MAAKSKRSLPKTAIIVLVGLLIVAGLFVWGRSSKSSNGKAAVKPQTSSSPSPSASATAPAPTGLGSLPQAPGGAASQGAAGQPTPVPGTPTQSTVNGTLPAYPLSANDSDITYCYWSPGAQCYLKFTSQSGITKTTPSTTVASSGSAKIIWQASMLSGDHQWTVQAMGVSNGKTVASSNPEPIYVN